MGMGVLRDSEGSYRWKDIYFAWRNSFGKIVSSWEDSYNTVYTCSMFIFLWVVGLYIEFIHHTYTMLRLILLLTKDSVFLCCKLHSFINGVD